MYRERREVVLVVKASFFNRKVRKGGARDAKE